MARRTRVKINRDGLRDVMTSDGAEKLVDDLANEAVAASNSESSWGGYSAYDASSPARARRHIVIAGSSSSDSSRVVRVLRNLG